MPGGKGNIRPEDGVQFGDPRHDKHRNTKGPPPSFKPAFAELFNKDGIHWVDEKKVKSWKSRPGKIGFPVSKQLEILMVAEKKALKGDMRAIEFLNERVDGKANQTKEVTKRVAPTAITIGFDPPDNCPHCNKSLLDEPEI